MHADLYRIPLVSLLFLTAAKAEVVSFTSLDLFLEAVDDIRIIDFATLPDGSPSVPGTPITPEFNYTDQGVTFSSAFPELRIGYPSSAGLALDAQNPDSNARNWLIADFSPPVFAVGVTFAGAEALSVYDVNQQLLDSATVVDSGFGLFLGFVSDTPIYQTVGDRGSSFQSWDTFFYAPVPEPATLVLFAFGAAAILGRTQRRLLSKGDTRDA